jgi:predicted membrane channel-forming protein YqfA (hemolysin III family)
VTQGLHEPLEAPAVKETVEALYGRIEARFPKRGLLGVCGDLVKLVDEVQDVAGAGQRRIRVARYISRVLMVIVLAVTIVALVFAARDAITGDEDLSSVDLLDVAGSAISDVVYAAIAIFFLWSFPERLERSRLLSLLHQLRSTAHVIDMHQLTKDPEQLKPSFVPTAKSTKLNMTRDQVERYLDYCSEMLSLVGKTAALCAEESRDSVILETVSTIENLTVGLSRKIWQKISNLPPGDPYDPGTNPEPVAVS